MLHLPAQLQFERVHFADELLVHLLDQRRIAGETARIESAHLLYQLLQLRLSLGTILNDCADSVEKIQSLVDVALGIRWVGTLLRCGGAPLNASIASVVTAIGAAPAIAGAAARIADGTSEAVAYTAPLWIAAVLTALTGLVALAAAALAHLSVLPLLALLALLAALSRLPIAGQLTALERLTSASRLTLALLTLARLSIGLPAQTVQLVAQAGEIVHGPVEPGFLRIALRSAQSAGSIADLLTQSLQIVRQRSFDRIGKLAGAQPIGTALQTAAKIVLVHAVEGAAQFTGCARLRRRQLPGRVAHLLGEAREIVGNLLAIVDHLVKLRGGYLRRLFAGIPRGAELRHQIAHMVRLLFLPVGELIGRLGHRVEVTRGVLLLRAAEQVGSFAQTVGGAAGVGRTCALGGGPLHIVAGLAQAFQRLLSRLLAAFRG